MAVFQDTWKLDIDTGFVNELGTAEAQLDRLDDSFDSVTRASNKTSTAFNRTEKALAKTEKEARQAAKALEREAAKGARVLAQAMRKAERETLREAAALDRARRAAKALKLDNTRKAVEGLSGAMGVATVNGETLANGWLAAGVIVGSLAASISGLATKSLTAYAKKNKEAGDAVERFNKANDRFLVGLGEAIFAEEKGVKALDSFAGRMDNFTAAIKKNKGEVRGFAEGIVDATEAVVTFYTFGLQAASFPFLGFADLVIAAGGVVLDFGLGVIETVALLLKGIGLLPEALAKDIVGVTDGVQANILAMTDITEGFVVSMHRSASATRDFSDDMAGAAKGSKDFSGKLQKSEKDLQEFTGPVKNWVDDDTGGKFAKSIRKISAEAAGFSGFAGDVGLDQFGAVEGALTGVVSRTAHRFGVGLLGSLDLMANEFEQIGKRDFKAEAAVNVDAKAKAAKGPGGDLLDISDQLGDFGASGIALATDQLGTFIETMAAGTFEAAEFGKGILTAVGSWIGDFGEAMIMAGVMSQFVNSGQLLIAPAAAIGLGLAAVTLGGLMSGIGGRGGGKASASSSADASARRTQRTLSNDRSSAEDRDDAAIIIMMDRAKVGEAVRADGQQASRRGQFNAGHSLRGLR